MAAIYIMATVINMAMITTNLRAVKLRPPRRCLVPTRYGWLPLAGGVLRSARQEHSGEAQEGKEIKSIFTCGTKG
jgi:hypothetical protein